MIRIANLKLLAYLLLALLTFQSCNKDGATVVPAPADPDRILTVLLNPDYLPAEKIDSACLIWKNTDGSADSVLLDAINGNLQVSFDRLPDMETEYRLQLYTSLNLSMHRLLWEKKFVATLVSQFAVNVAAPVELNDVNWLPRIMLNDQTGLLAFSGIRPTDPYFEVCKVHRSWQQITVDRSYWNTIGGVQHVAGGVWKGTGVLDATGSYRNDNFFSFIPEQIGNQPWNHIEIIMLFTNDTNTETRLMDFNHSF